MLVSGTGVEAVRCTNATAKSASWMMSFILALIPVLAVVNCMIRLKDRQVSASSSFIHATGIDDVFLVKPSPSSCFTVFWCNGGQWEAIHFRNYGGGLGKCRASLDPAQQASKFHWASSPLRIQYLCWLVSMPTVNGCVRDMALLISPSVLKYLYNFRVVNIRGVSTNGHYQTSST